MNTCERVESKFSWDKVEEEEGAMWELQYNRIASKRRESSM